MWTGNHGGKTNVRCCGPTRGGQTTDQTRHGLSHVYNHLDFSFSMTLPGWKSTFGGSGFLDWAFRAPADELNFDSLAVQLHFAFGLGCWAGGFSALTHENGSIPHTIDHQQTGPCNPLKVGLIVFTLRDKGPGWNPGLKPLVEAYPNKNSTAAAARVAYPILIRHHDG